MGCVNSNRRVKKKIEDLKVITNSSPDFLLKVKQLALCKERKGNLNTIFEARSFLEASYSQDNNC
jgi:hypothetical protein